jgi:hypothetical protein
LREAVKNLDNKGEKSFWKALNLILKPKYGPQYKEMKAIWAQYEVCIFVWHPTLDTLTSSARAGRFKKKETGTFQQSIFTTWWPRSLGKLFQANVAKCQYFLIGVGIICPYFVSVSGTASPLELCLLYFLLISISIRSDAQQQQLSLSRPIWSQEDYQRFCRDSEHQSQGLTIPPNSMMEQSATL